MRSAQRLLDLGVGDTGRLAYIISVLKQGKKFYLTDQKYLNNLISQHKYSYKKQPSIMSVKLEDSSTISEQGVTTSNQVSGTSVIVGLVETSMDELRIELKSINEKLGKIETKIEPSMVTKAEPVVETKSAETEINDSSVKVEKHIGRKVFLAFTLFVGWHVVTNNAIYNIFSETPSNLTMYLLPLYTLIELAGASRYLLVFVLRGMLVALVNLELVNLRKHKTKNDMSQIS